MFLPIIEALFSTTDKTTLVYWCVIFVRTQDWFANY